MVKGLERVREKSAAKFGGKKGKIERGEYAPRTCARKEPGIWGKGVA